MKDKNLKSGKLWGGRFQESQSDLMERIGESISFDKELYNQDIEGSIAHSRMLAKIGILSPSEQAKIEKGLGQIRKEIESGDFLFQRELEDIHMHIESRLTDLIGEPGKKLHTGRSRNDQVGQDVRLFILDHLEEVFKQLGSLQDVLLSRAEKSLDIIFPGYTHLQIAQPIRASHYLLAYFWAFLRDWDSFLQAYKTADQLVLGSGALAGVNYSTDRSFLLKELDLSSISPNSMDAVAQRDHLLQYMYAATQFMIHASRLAEEIILYSSIEFSYIRLPDRLTSGSSIMPQKKNPDVAELIRGKSGIVTGNFFGLLALMKGTPMAYNRDFQEDKPSIFQTAKHLLLSIEGLKEILEGFEFRTENIEKSLNKGFATATDLADWLVKGKGIPFREAHEIVGKLVQICVEKGLDLFSVSVEDRKSVSKYLGDSDYWSAISLSESTDKKDVFGGTARKRQLEQLKIAKKEWTNRLKSRKIRKSKSKNFDLKTKENKGNIRH
jgi:argininosuccinate lyase